MPLRPSSVLAAALMLAAAPISAQEARLSAVHSLPATNDLMRSYFAFIEDVNANGQGILQIDVRGGVEVIPQGEQLNATARGIVDIYMGPAGYFQGQLPELETIDGTASRADVLREAGFHDMLDAAMRERMGVSLLGLMGTGYSFQFYLLNPPRLTDDGGIDLSGMRIRGGPSYDPMFEALGIINVAIPVGDIFTALERGVVDGIGFTTIGVSSAGWQNFLRYRIFPTWRQGNTILAINAAARDRLTEEQHAFLMEMVQKHELLAYEGAQELERIDTEALAAAGVEDVHLTGEGADRLIAAFQDTFWKSVAGNIGEEAASGFRAVVDAANSM